MVKKTEGQWVVFDMNARQLDPDKPGKVIARSHEAVPGFLYALTFNTPCHMPEAHARVFLKDPSFRVLDANGTLVPGLAKEALSRTLPQRLPSNLVIADLHELTSEALLTRAAQRQGGSRLSGDTPREMLLQFLQDGLEAEETGHVMLSGPRAIGRAQDAPDAGDIEEESDADADEMAAKMLEGA